MNLLNFSKLAIFGWEEGLARDILKKYNEMQQDILNTINDIKPHLSTSPQDYSNDTWNLVTGISSNIVLVIAGLLFAYIMTLELIDMITQKNNYHDLELYQIYVWIFKLGIGILVLQNYVVIMNAIFAVGNWGLEKVIGLINLDMQKIDFGVNEETVKKLTQDNDFVALFLQNMTTFLMVWAFKFIGVLVHVVIIGRYFEIYLYTMLGTIAIACLVSKEYKNIGINFIKNMFILALQGLVIIVCLGIYVTLLSTITKGEMTNPYVILAFGIVLVLSLFKTKTILQSIFMAN